MNMLVRFFKEQVMLEEVPEESNHEYVHQYSGTVKKIYEWKGIASYYLELELGANWCVISQDERDELIDEWMTTMGIVRAAAKQRMTARG